MITIAPYPRHVHQFDWGQWMVQGLEAHGTAYRLIDAGADADTEIVATWGWKMGRYYRARGHQVLVAERGYVGDRMVWTSLGWNGLNGRATFPKIDDGGARWNRHHRDVLRPWSPERPKGYILVMGQVPGDQSVVDHDIDGWYTATIRTLRETFDRPVYFRTHPRAIERGLPAPPRAAPELGGPLDAALSGAAWVVTFNSNSAVDAVLAGTRAIACDPGSMAWDVTGHDPRQAGVPSDRAAWAHRLAWCQWRPDEIASGAAWDAVSTVSSSLEPAA